jgi:hypothetical protein
MTVEQAKQEVLSAGLNISLSGGAVDNKGAIAVGMSAEPGASLYEGSVVEVNFAINSGHGG